MNLQQALDVIEKQTKELRHEYELFFSGEIRVEPLKLRRELQRVIGKMSNAFIANTALRFRFQSLQATFNSFQRLWDRTLNEIESGRYAPHRFKADHHIATEPAETKALPEFERLAAAIDNKPAMPSGDVERLFGEYVQARKVTGEAGRVSMDKFRESLEKQIPELEKKLGGKVSFKISVENGKAKVKGVRV